jgi:uncharacterized protein (DUF302 family)
MALPSFGTPHYGLTRRFPNLSPDQAVEEITAALATQGFGILTEINVQTTFEAKLDVGIGSYRILGACNPGLAHQALSLDPAMGLLMPCNVVVAEDPDGQTVVSIAEPGSIFEPLHRDDLNEFATEIRNRLQSALDAVGVD